MLASDEVQRSWSEPLKLARLALLHEFTGLQALCNAMSFYAELAEQFDRAVTHTLTPPAGARLIVTGIGKSGLVGAKMAATFASLGTPAMFLHAADALHGDLGKIQPCDMVVGLSVSGNTAETNYVLAYAQELGAWTALITANKQCSGAEFANVLLQLPEHTEACANNLAPTTSTIMMMALGDAWAVTLAQLRKQTSEQFKRMHPAGALAVK